MKKINIIRLIAFVGLLATISLTSCDKVVDLEIDPIDVKNDFTFSPEVGHPGQTVTIEGKGLDKVIKVAIGSAQAEFTATPTQIKAEIPENAKTGKIHLTYENRVEESTTSFAVSSTPLPTITGFSPLQVSSGKEVVIEGTLLTQIKTIMIGDLKAEIVEGGTDEAITIVTPVGFTTNYITFSYDYTTDYKLVLESKADSPYKLGLLLPSVESIDDNVDISNLDIGDELKIRGTSFDLIQEVWFGEVQAEEFAVKEDEEGEYLSVKVPEGATEGKIRLIAEDGEIDQEELTTDFVIFLPSITSFTPEMALPLPGETRPFSILGANLNAVTEVYVGEDLAEIVNQSETQILLTLDGESNGIITLHSSNGAVESITPLSFQTDFWVNDWDENISPVFGKLESNNVSGGVVVEIVEEGGNNYAQLAMTDLEHSQSFYLWGENPGHDDWFGLHLSSPDIYYLKFDIRVEDVDEAILDENGNIQMKVFTMDTKGWGASGEFSYGANSPTVDLKADGEWHSYKMHLADFIASGNS
ncbi:MAG: autotransporter protein, partial [Bacteroidales bacterium]|nr:autotransporter protein [Bacteroidales bacterium]